MVANDNPVLDTTGNLVTNIKGKPFSQPWGQVFAQPKNAARRRSMRPTPATARSFASISDRKFTYDVIATRFPVNHGNAGHGARTVGSLLRRKIDTLYFADGKNNTIVAFKNVTKIKSGGIKADEERHGVYAVLRPRARVSSSRASRSTARSAPRCCRTAISSSATRSIPTERT